MIKVSVIIPVYNVERYLRACLDSVLQQDLDGIELICVEDGSTDSSEKILKEYVGRDSRIGMISYGKNEGPAFARNRALEQAQGEYIFFLDADDVMPKGILKECYDRAASDCLDGLLYDMNYLEREQGLWKTRPIICWKRAVSETCSGVHLAKTMMQNLPWTATMALWRRGFLEKHRISFHEGIYYEDSSFSMQAMLMAERVRFFQKVCYLYRIREASITTSQPSMRHLRGRLAAMADMVRDVIAEGEEFSDEKFSVASWFMMRQLDFTRSIAKQVGVADCTHGSAACAAEQLILKLALRNGKCFVRGFLDKETEKKLRSERVMIVYGAGVVGREVISVFEEYGIRNYRLAVTKHLENDGGIRAYAKELHEFQELRESALVIVAARDSGIEEMMRIAKGQGFQRVVPYDAVL